MEADRTAAAEWRGHWPLVAASMLGMSFFSLITYTLGTFIEPLEQQFGWSRAQISLGLTIFTAVNFFGGPLIGGVIDRFGTRRIAIPAMALTGMAFAAFSFANGSIAQWLALWLVLAVASMGIKTTIWSAGINSVFTVGRGFALAVMLCGTALAQSVAPLTANWLIEAHSWRAAYVGIGLGWGGLTLLLLALFFFDARELRKRAGPAAAAVATAVTAGGLSMSEAMRDPRILRIAGCALLMSLPGSGLTVHLVPILSGTGLDRGSAVEIAALTGFAGLIGKLGAGWLLDRMRGSLLPFLSYALPAASYFLLLYPFGKIGLSLAAIMMGLGAGAGMQVITYLTSRYAGQRNFGAIFGSIGSMMMLGTAIGPLLAGLLYDQTGSYTILLIASIPAMLLAALLLVGLGPYPDWDKPEREALT